MTAAPAPTQLLNTPDQHPNPNHPAQRQPHNPRPQHPITNHPNSIHTLAPCGAGTVAGCAGARLTGGQRSC